MTYVQQILSDTLMHDTLLVSMPTMTGQIDVAKHVTCVISQAWGKSTRYFGTLVLEYRFCSTRRYSVLVLLKSTCTRTCTQVLLKIRVLLTSTYEYFTSTSHLK